MWMLDKLDANPLHVAAFKGDIEGIRKILREKGTRHINMRDEAGMTPLSYLLISDKKVSFQDIHMMYENGADIKLATDCLKLDPSMDNERHNALAKLGVLELHASAIDGRMYGWQKDGRLNEELDKRSSQDINAQDIDGNTPLAYILGMCDLPDGITPSDYLEIIWTMCQHGADLALAIDCPINGPNAKDARSIYVKGSIGFYWTYMFSVKDVRKLFNQFLPNYVPPHHMTLLNVCMDFRYVAGKREIISKEDIDELIDMIDEDNCDFPNSYGETPLMISSRYSTPELIRKLLHPVRESPPSELLAKGLGTIGPGIMSFVRSFTSSQPTLPRESPFKATPKGANPNSLNKYGESVLHFMAHYGNYVGVKYMLDNSLITEVEIEDFDGRTPLERLIFGFWNLDLYYLLMSNGANIHHIGYMGVSIVERANTRHVEKEIKDIVNRDAKKSRDRAMLESFNPFM